MILVSTNPQGGYDNDQARSSETNPQAHGAILRLLSEVPLTDLGYGTLEVHSEVLKLMSCYRMNLSKDINAEFSMVDTPQGIVARKGMRTSVNIDDEESESQGSQDSQTHRPPTTAPDRLGRLGAEESTGLTSPEEPAP